ncbi:Ger(x)C family spore germination protein [Paenibacillus guangzhouensis]|uniref:Ger(x)C family spore germination protein n=1 Tax=Paenibacillus guangzhouensis TaxID=1473112 RepID=UPI00126767CA|nr:Ger(x)C family spore germination protein [Paenibacillus guangzhouensis]
MIRRVALVLCLLLLCSSMTGCWSRRELNELSLTMGIGLDKRGNRYTLSVEVINPEAMAQKGSTGSAVGIYREEGRSILECLRRLTTRVPRYLYMAHLRIMVIGEELAREGISNVLDFFMRDNDLRPDFYVIVAKNDEASDILQYPTQLERIPANKLYNSLENSGKQWSPAEGIHLDELVSNLTSHGSYNAVLPGIEVSPNLPLKAGLANEANLAAQSLKYSGLGVFQGDKLIGWLNEDESRAANYLRKRVKHSLGQVKCGPEGDGVVSIKTDYNRVKMRAKLIQGKPHITIHLDLEGTIGEVQCGINLLRVSEIQKIEDEAERGVNELLLDSVRNVQKKYKSDIFGFGQVFHRQQQHYWNRVKKDWVTIFPTVGVEVKTTLKIKGTETENNTFIWDMKKE